MALRFRRRQKLFPGVYLNFSSKGISTTIGIPGLNVNLNNKGAYLNTGIPGTGLSSREQIAAWDGKRKPITHEIEQVEETPYYFMPEQLEGEIKSKNANSVTSKGLTEVKETYKAAYQERLDIQNEISEEQKKEKTAKIICLLSKILLIGFAMKSFDKKLSDRREYLKSLQKQFSECMVETDIKIENTLSEKYKELKKIFIELSTCQKIWDTTSEKTNDDNRSAANTSITRHPTTVGYNKINFINSEYEALYFQNQNSGDIYIYPAFAVLFDNQNSFGLIDLSELEITFSLYNFIEEEQVPSDSEVIGTTWLKVNKNGTPDKRFKGNYQIPIVLYGELTFKSNSGVNEVFLFSNSQKAMDFQKAYQKYLDNQE